MSYDKTENAISEEMLSKVSGGDVEENQPEMRRYDDYCRQHYQTRYDENGNVVHIIYVGLRYTCENCIYFSTDPNTPDQLDPKYDGLGYCFYGIK